MSALRLALDASKKQLGVVTRRQLLAVGVTDHQIRHLLEAGAFVALHRGVFVAAGATNTLEQAAVAACLACGDGAVASHSTAGAILKICNRSEYLEVTVPYARRPRRDGILISRSTALGPADCARCGPVRITSAARTLVDLAGVFDRDRLALTSDEAFRRGLTSPAPLLRYMERPSIACARGVGTLRSIARDRLAEGTPESDLEGRMVELLRCFRLPPLVRQHKIMVGGRRVRFDLAYPEKHIVVELEGWEGHSGRDRWQSDHDRHNAVELAEWRTLQFTWTDVTQRPYYVAFTIAEKLGLRPARWVPYKRPG